MYSTVIDLGSNFVTSTLAQAGSLAGDFTPLITVFAIVALAVIAITLIIRVLVHR